MSARTRHLSPPRAPLPTVATILSLAMALAISAWGLAAAGCAQAEANRLAVTYYYLPG